MGVAAAVARGVSIRLAGRFVSLVLSFVILSVTVHYLSAAQYGVLTTIVAFVGLFDIFVDMGIGTVIVRRVTSGRAAMERLVGVSLGLSLLYAWPLWLLAVAASIVVFPGRTDVQLGVLILGAGIVLNTVSTSYLPVYEVAVRYGAITAAEVAGKVLSLGALLVIIDRDWGLLGVVAVQLIPILVNFLVVMLASRTHGRFRPQFSSGIARSMIREALPLAGVIMVSIAYLRIDAILLSLLSTEQEVGAYGLAYRLASNVAIVSSIFANTVFAPTADAFAAGRERFLRVVTRSLQFMLLAALPVAAFGWLLAGQVLELIAPSDLAAMSTPPAQLLLVAIACGFVNAVLAGALVAAHRQRALLISSCVILVLNVVANVVLIPRYQATGSAAALVVSEGVATVVSVAILVRVTGWQVPWKFLTRLLVPVGVTFLVLLPLADGPLWISLPVGAVVYLGGLWLLGPIRPPELLHVMRQPSALTEPEVRSTD